MARHACIDNPGLAQPRLLTGKYGKRGEGGKRLVDLTIRLLGMPSIERGGQPLRPPRGRKAWAVLAYLLLTDRQVSRQNLAELLFGEADDPLGALRWTLAELRRAIGVAEAFRGDPVSAGLDGAVIDIDIVSLTQHDPFALLQLCGDLLEGLSIDGCPVFESWLVVERYRLSAEIEARLRQTAVGLIAEGRVEDAVIFASRAVARNVLDEGNHELLVRCLAAAGDEAGALRQVAVCEDTLRRELGVEASSALRAAARWRDASTELPVSGRSEVQSLLEAGRAAVAAGAVEAGLDCLQRAVVKAASCDDTGLHGRSLVALGGALVHGVRGRDGEGSIILHESIRVASSASDDHAVMTACRELGSVEVQAGRRPTATAWLERATALADRDESRASILGVQGMNVSDMGHYAEAFRFLHESVELAERCGDARQQAWSLSILARAHLLREEHSQAADAVNRSLELAQEQRWLAFLPWPRALKAELDLRNGHEDTVAVDIEQAWALSCQLGDPCWEGMTARVLGLLSARRGDYPSATAWLEEAHRRCSAVTDRYQWVRAYVLDAMIEVAWSRHDHSHATELVDSLASVAARCEMREFVVRAHLHRWRLGDPGALAAGRLLATDVDNPALHRALDAPREFIDRYPNEFDHGQKDEHQ